MRMGIESAEIFESSSGIWAVCGGVLCGEIMVSANEKKEIVLFSGMGGSSFLSPFLLLNLDTSAFANSELKHGVGHDIIRTTSQCRRVR